MWIKALQDAMDNVNPAACRNTNHKFKLTTFDIPRSCQRCGRFLKGRIFQVRLKKLSLRVFLYLNKTIQKKILCVLINNKKKYIYK